MPDDIWEANTIRLTLFPVTPLDPRTDLWQPIFGNDPDTEETRPKEGFKRQAGPWGGGAVEIQLNPLRLDVAVGPPPADVPADRPSLPDLTFGPSLEKIDEFAQLILPWVTKLPFEVTRLAISGNAMIEKDNLTETYAVIQQYVKSVNIIPSKMKELIYRVNWPHETDLIGYYNNIQVWSSIIFQGRVVPTGLSQATLMQQKFLAQLQFDVNTPEDRHTALDQGMIGPIFEEMLSLAIAGLTEGERPLPA